MRVLAVVACCLTSITLPAYADEPTKEEIALCATIQSGQWAERELGSFESCLQLTRNQISAERIRFGRWGAVLIAYDGSGFLISGDEGKRWKLLQSLELPVEATPPSADPAETATPRGVTAAGGVTADSPDQNAEPSQPTEADPGNAGGAMDSEIGGKAVDPVGGRGELEASAAPISAGAPIEGKALSERVTESSPPGSAPLPPTNAAAVNPSDESEAPGDSGLAPSADAMGDGGSPHPDAVPEVDADPGSGRSDAGGAASPTARIVEVTVNPDNRKKPVGVPEAPLQASSIEAPNLCRIKSSDRWIQSNAPSLLVCAKLLDQSPEIYDQKGYKYAYWRDQLLAATRHEVYAVDQESRRTSLLKRHRYPSGEGHANNADSHP